MKLKEVKGSRVWIGKQDGAKMATLDLLFEGGKRAELAPFKREELDAFRATCIGLIGTEADWILDPAQPFPNGDPRPDRTRLPI